MAIFYVEFTKKKITFKTIHKHPACKMNRGEQGGGSKSFERTYFLNDPKVFLLQLRSIF